MKRIKWLEARLEISPDTKVDGIAARGETIRIQDEKLAKASARNKELEAKNAELRKACKAVVDWVDNNPPAGEALYCVQMCRKAIAV